LQLLSRHSFPTRRSSDLIAHAEYAGGHTFRVEGFEPIHFLGHPDKLNRFLSNGADRQCCPAARIAVELRQRHACNIEQLVKAFRSEEHTSELQSRFDLVC